MSQHPEHDKDQANEARQLYVAEVALRTFARSATGPGDRPQSLTLLLAEYDRRAERIAELERRWAGRTERAMKNRVVTPEAREMLAAALEEAALRVRQSQPDSFEIDVENDVARINVGGEHSIPGMRSPLRRVFRIEW